MKMKTVPAENGSIETICVSRTQNGKRTVRRTQEAQKNERRRRNCCSANGAENSRQAW